MALSKSLKNKLWADEQFSFGTGAVKSMIRKFQSGQTMALFGRTREYWMQVSRMCRAAIHLMGIEKQTLRFITGAITTGSDNVAQAADQGISFTNGNELVFEEFRAPGWMLIGTAMSNMIANNYTDYSGTGIVKNINIMSWKDTYTQDKAGGAFSDVITINDITPEYEESGGSDSSTDSSGSSSSSTDKDKKEPFTPIAKPKPDNLTQPTAATASSSVSTTGGGKKNVSNYLGADLAASQEKSKNYKKEKKDEDKSKGAGDVDGEAADFIFKGALDYGTVSFMTSGPVDVSENTQSSFGEGPMSEFFNKITGITGGAGASGIVKGLINAIQGSHGASDGFLNFLVGQHMLPDAWNATKSSRSYQMEFQFTTPYGDPVSIFMNIIYPLIKLYALALPEATGGILYQPWIVNTYSNGGINIEWGAIEAINVTKNMVNLNDWGMPTELKVQVTLRDLKPFIFMEKPKFWSFASKHSGSVTTVLATMVGRNLTTISYDDKEQLLERLAKLNYAEKADAFTTDIKGIINQKVSAFKMFGHRIYKGITRPLGDFATVVNGTVTSNSYDGQIGKGNK